MAAYWYVGADGASKGPVELEELARLARAGEVTPATLVWTDGMAEWAPAGSIAALTALLSPAPAAPPPLAGRRLPGAVPSYTTAPVGDLAPGRLVTVLETFPLVGDGQVRLGARAPLQVLHQGRLHDGDDGAFERPVQEVVKVLHGVHARLLPTAADAVVDRLDALGRQPVGESP